MRRDAPVVCEFTEQEARALRRAAELLMVLLGVPVSVDGVPPMVTAQQVLVAACERAGVECEASLMDEIDGVPA